jgi:ABC-type sulfate transport system permease component
MFIVALGALCFGLLVGWIVSRILRQGVDLPWLQNLIALAGIIIGAAVLALFKDAGLFGWYAVGLLLGFLAFLALGVVLYGKQELQSWRGESLASPTAPEV